MKVFTYFLLILIFFSQTCVCLNVIKLDGHLSLDKIKRDPLVEISLTQSLLEPSTNSSQVQNFQFFLLKSVSRHKNKTYLKLLKNYQKLVNILIQKLIIGDQKLLIKSKIKQKFIKRKKMWQFGIMFMMQGQQGELNQCYHQIAKLGVIRMSEKPKTTTLNQRIIASNAFNKLKTKIFSQLRRMPGMTILKVQSVQINGFSIPDLIQMDNKQNEQNFEIQESQKDQQISYFLDYYFSKAQLTRQSKQFSIKAVFKIGQQSQVQQSQSVEYESQEESSSQESQRSQYENHSYKRRRKYN